MTRRLWTLLLPAFLLLSGCSQGPSSYPSRTEGASNGSTLGSPGTRMLDLTAENWSFSPAEVRVREGEHVTLRIVSLSETHSFAVPALGIDLPLYPGEPVTVDLPTDVPGTYDFFCSIPCGSGHEDMRGTIVVEEQD